MPPSLLDLNRYVYQEAAPREGRRLLQTALSAELIAPSPCLWVVSAWISNIPVLDNRANGFRAVEPRWPIGRVPLATVIAQLLHAGVTVHLATRPESSADFIAALEQAAGYDGRPTPSCPLYLHTETELDQHRKGILSHRFYLRGTMNFTHNGIGVNDERVEFTVDPEAVANARGHFEEQWGGPFPGAT
ncbi:MAG: hypothetical protein SangKO_099910 [Sandaracinaceae bacterium]